MLTIANTTSVFTLGFFDILWTARQVISKFSQVAEQSLPNTTAPTFPPIVRWRANLFSLAIVLNPTFPTEQQQQSLDFHFHFSLFSCCGISFPVLSPCYNQFNAFFFKKDKKVVGF